MQHGYRQSNTGFKPEICCTASSSGMTRIESSRISWEDIEIADAKPKIVVNDAVKNIIKAVDAENMESTFEDRFGVRFNKDVL